ncbi:MAG: hypothetical protein E4H20_08080, partial [Spirochaetales bacterium]
MAGKLPRMAVYGGTNVDIQAHCRQHFKPGDSNPGSSSLAAGGVGRNIAENLVGLGATVELVTVFGDDDLAAFLMRSCRQSGIDVAASLFLREESSPRYLCILDVDGSLVGAVAAMDALDRFDPAVLADRWDPGDRADVVILDANLPADTLAAAAERWRGKPILLDTVSASKAVKALPLLPYVSMIKPNRVEAAILSGLEPGGEAEALAAARAIRRAGTAEVFVSLGAGGLLWCGSEGEGIARPLGLPVVNVSGAGDAAAAALA